jgi:hypothetical protein
VLIPSSDSQARAAEKRTQRIHCDRATQQHEKDRNERRA